MHPQTAGCPLSSKAGFSLVELLVVIAMIAILTATTGPALLSSQRSSKLTDAGNRLADMAALARQSALSRNVVTALVLVSGSGDASLDGRAATLLEMDVDRTWKQAGGWVVLADGVKATDAAAGGALPAGAGLPALKVRGKAVDLSQCRAFVFYPDGRMDGDPQQPRRLSVKLDAAGSSAINSYDLVFNIDTSTVRVVRP